MQDATLDLERAIREEESRLVGEFGPRLGDEVVRKQLRAAVDELADARVKSYISVIAYRLTRDRLAELAAREPVPA